MDDPTFHDRTYWVDVCSFNQAEVTSSRDALHSYIDGVLHGLRTRTRNPEPGIWRTVSYHSYIDGVLHGLRTGTWNPEPGIWRT